MKRIHSKEHADKLIQAGAFLADMRDPVSFRDGHISGAKNLPLKNLLNTIMGMDKKSTLLIYGENADVEQGAKYAVTLGFSHVYVADFESMQKPAEDWRNEKEWNQLSKMKPNKKPRKPHDR